VVVRPPNKTSFVNKTISIVLLVGGSILISYGIGGSGFFGPDLSHFFTGSPADHSFWLLVGGIAPAAIGVGGLLRGAKSI
jgi:hypothetical protein